MVSGVLIYWNSSNSAFLNNMRFVLYLLYLNTHILKLPATTTFPSLPQGHQYVIRGNWRVPINALCPSIATASENLPLTFSFPLRSLLFHKAAHLGASFNPNLKPKWNCFKLKEGFYRSKNQKTEEAWKWPQEHILHPPQSFTAVILLLLSPLLSLSRGLSCLSLYISGMF